jgi:hypothetical protein
VIPSLIFISRSASSAGLCFVFPVPVQLVRTRLFHRPGARFSSAVSCCPKFFCSARVDRPLDQVFHARSRIPLKRSFLYCLARGFCWCHRRSFIFATEIFFPDFILRQQIPFSLRQCPIFVSVGGQLEAFPEGFFFAPSALGSRCWRRPVLIFPPRRSALGFFSARQRFFRAIFIFASATQFCSSSRSSLLPSLGSCLSAQRSQFFCRLLDSSSTFRFR